MQCTHDITTHAQNSFQLKQLEARQLCNMDNLDNFLFLRPVPCCPGCECRKVSARLAQPSSDCTA